jgi:6-phospho-beta-glucosidase
MSSSLPAVKVAVIGGGSTYTPELIDGIAQRDDRLPVRELALMDVSTERLEVVGGLARRIMDRLGWAGRITTTTSTEEAVDGASFVLVQLRVGGQQARMTDETIPPRFGTVGQETTGAGGFAKALI